MKKCFSFALALFLAAGFSAQVRSATVIKLRVGSSTEATHTSIAEALTAAEEGHDIEVESGTYAVSDALLVNKGVTIRGLGDSPEDVVVTRDTSSGNHRLLTITASGARLENMTFSDGIVPEKTNDKSKPQDASSIAYMTAGTISNCIIQNGRAENDSGWATGIILNGTAQVAPILER